MGYCTVNEVLSVARTFRNDVLPDSATPDDVARFRTNTNTIEAEEIEDLIEESSEMVRSLLQPRYDRAVIDAFAPDYPLVIVYLTKSYAAVLMYERFSGASVQRDETLIKSLQRSMIEYKRIIVNGGLVDTTDTRVPTQVDPVGLQGADNTDFTADGEMQELWENGRQY